MSSRKLKLGTLFIQKWQCCPLYLKRLMCLSQSVVLWQGRGGIQKTALFGKSPSPYYGKNSSNKQREITLHHYFHFITWSQSLQNISRTLKVPSSAVAKTIKRCDETVSHEDRHRKGRPSVTSAAEDKFIRVNCSSDCSPNKCFTEFRHLNINCSEETAWIWPSWSNCCKETTNKQHQ